MRLLFALVLHGALLTTAPAWSRDVVGALPQQHERMLPFGDARPTWRASDALVSCYVAQGSAAMVFDAFAVQSALQLKTRAAVVRTRMHASLQFDNWHAGCYSPWFNRYLFVPQFN